MPRRKKYPKLPNGYGSIKYLGKNRRNPYAVHPPTTEFSLAGSPVTPKALCYVDSWVKGFAVLTAYKAGTYYPGMEKVIQSDSLSESDSNLLQKILADYTLTKAVDGKLAAKNVIVRCTLKHASKELIVSLFHQMYKYAEICELCEKDYSVHVRINSEDDDEHGVPFSDDELHILWEHKDDPVVEFILIMCYSGYRIAAYKTIEVNTKEWYFKGGVKTQAGKGRTVPIHSAIRPLVAARLERSNCMLDVTAVNFRKAIADITNAVYGHRSLADLRAEIEKIEVCY